MGVDGEHGELVDRDHGARHCSCHRPHRGGVRDLSIPVQLSAIRFAGLVLSADWAVQYFTLIGFAVAGVALWIWARPATRIIAGPQIDSPNDDPMTAGDLVAAGSFVIGVYFIVSWGPYAASMSAWWVWEFARSRDAYPPRMEFDSLEPLISSWIGVLAGICLAVRPGLLVWLFRRVRGESLGRVSDGDPNIRS